MQRGNKITISNILRLCSLLSTAPSTKDNDINKHKQEDKCELNNNSNNNNDNNNNNDKNLTGFEKMSR